MPEFATTSFSQTLIETDKNQYWTLKIEAKGSSVWYGNITYKEITNLPNNIFIYDNKKLTKKQIENQCSQ